MQVLRVSLCAQRGVSPCLHNPNDTLLADTGQCWPLTDQADGHSGYDFVIAEPGNHCILGTENEETVSYFHLV